MAVAFVKAHTVVTEKTLDTTASVTVDTGGIPAGNLIVLAIVFDNAATVGKPVISTITKMAGETASWVSLGASRHPSSTSIGAFAGGELWAIKTTIAWSAATYTVTLDTSVTQKAAAFLEFSGAEATARSTAGTNYSTTTTAASAATTGTTPVIGDLAVGFLFGSNIATIPASDTDTLGGSWSTAIGIGSTGGSAATNNFGAFQYKILTGANHQTFNSSAAGAAGNGSIVAILQPTPDPAVTQAAYRLYTDGTETGSTALAAQDTAATADLTSGDVNLGVRVRVQSTNTGALGATDDWQLQWEKNTSGFWSNVGGPSIFDAYAETNRDGSLSVGFTDIPGYGQSFLGDGSALTRARFFLSKVGSPTGTLTAYLYAHTGTFGSGGTGTGAALATSTSTVSAAAVSAPGTYSWYDFDFDGTFTMAAGTPYVIAVESDTFSGTNYIAVGSDGSSPTHAGNASQRKVSTGWSSPGRDLIFEVYGPSTTAVPYASANLTDAAATTNRLGSGTGTFTAGKVSEDGLADNLGWSASNHTELLYSITLKQADLANGDTLKFRVLRNGATTGLTYTQTPTINVTVGAGVPSGTGAGGYDFTKTTATGAKAPIGSSVAGTYAFNRTTATGYKTQSGTAVGAYAWDRTAATGVAPVTPKTGTAAGAYAFDKTAAAGTKTPRGTTTGTYAFNRTAATGAVVKSGSSTTGTYAWNRTAATGAKVQRGTAVGAYAWDRTAATGTAPVVGAKTGTAAGTYAFNRTAATGARTAQGSTVGGTYTWTGNATGLAPVVGGASGTAIGAYLWARTTATGTKTTTGTAAGGYAFNRTAATGSKAPRGTATGAYTYAGTAAGTRVQRGTATGSYAWDRTTATGSRPAGAVAVGTWNWSGTATGVRPLPGIKQGTAQGFYAFDRTAAVGSAPVIPVKTGTAAGTYTFNRTAATGVVVRRGTGAGGFAWNRTTATGYKLPKASSSGTYLYAGTATGAVYNPDPHPATTTARDQGTATTADFRTRSTLRDARAHITLDETTAATVRTFANATTTKENA